MEDTYTASWWKSVLISSLLRLYAYLILITEFNDNHTTKEGRAVPGRVVRSTAKHTIVANATLFVQCTYVLAPLRRSEINGGTILSGYSEQYQRHEQLRRESGSLNTILTSESSGGL